MNLMTSDEYPAYEGAIRDAYAETVIPERPQGAEDLSLLDGLAGA